MTEPTIKVGQTIKSFGKDGHIRVVIDKPYVEDILRSRYLFVKKEGFLLPYFIEHFDHESSLIKFDEIHSPEEGRTLSDSELYLFRKDVSKVNTNLPKEGIIGYTLIDQNEKIIGTIIEVLDMPMQVLLNVKILDNEILVPFHEDLLIDFDPKNKILVMELAEGLDKI